MLDQLGPDAMPVIRAKILARHDAAGGPFDLYATLCGDGSSRIRPLADEDRRNVELGGESTLGSTALEVVNESHNSDYSKMHSSHQ